MVQFLLESAVTETSAVAETVADAAPLTDGIIGHALFITGVGMGILFLSLLILWGVMELLVRIVKDAPKTEEEEIEAPVAVQISDNELKARAAAAAAASIQDYDLKLKVAAAAAGYVVAKK